MTRARILAGWPAWLALALLAGTVAGCGWRARSGLPAHIRSVEVEMFSNVTFEPGLEAGLTREIKRLVGEDPQVRLVNGDGDARISGRILKVTRRAERLGRDDRPVDMGVVLEVEYSFYDMVEQKYLVARQVVDSRRSSSLAGLYRVTTPERGPANQAEVDAIGATTEAVAREIVRGTVGMW